MRLNIEKLKQKVWKDRIFFVKVFFLIALLLIVFRMFYLEVIKHEYYLKLAKKQSITRYILLAPRGEIKTADGVVIATNRAIFKLYVDIESVKGKEDEIFYRLSKLLGVNFGELKERYVLGKKYSFGRVLLKRDLTWDQVAKVLTRLYYLPGVSIEAVPERYYPYKQVYFHLVGYVAKITKKEYESKKKLGYSIEDYVGRRALERAFERELKGINGYIEIEKDAYGRLGKIVKRVNPIPGKDLILTVKHKYQMFAYKLMKDKLGAFVAISPKGELLAMVSTPSIDPQKFVEGFTTKEWERVKNDPRRPLINKTLSPYPPGSTFKLVTAFAGWEAGIIKSAKESIYCSGEIFFKNRNFRCWKVHYQVDFFKAIYESCNIYFYWIGSKLDVDYLAKIAKELGLGEKTGIGWVEEKKGLVPTKEWKRRVLKEIWYPGETLLFSIGQGFLTATPLQMARLYMAIANGGILYKIWVVKAIKDFSSGEIQEFFPIVERIIDFNEQFLAYLQEALIDVVEKGTGTRAKVEGILVAGKTGTAQTVSSEIEELHKKRKWITYAWFVSYAGRKIPEIITAILIENENGGHGGTVAAPIAGEFYKYCFGNDTGNNTAI